MPNAFSPVSSHWSRDDAPGVPDRKPRASRLIDAPSFPEGQAFGRRQQYADNARTVAVNPRTLRPTRFTGDDDDIVAWIMGEAAAQLTGHTPVADRWNNLIRRTARSIRPTIERVMSGDVLPLFDDVIVGDMQHAERWCAENGRPVTLETLTDRVATMRVRRAEKRARRHAAQNARKPAPKPAPKHTPAPVFTPAAPVFTPQECCRAAGSVADCATHRPV